jgi:hypothetical protein
MPANVAEESPRAGVEIRRDRGVSPVLAPLPAPLPAQWLLRSLLAVAAVVAVLVAVGCSKPQIRSATDVPPTEAQLRADLGAQYADTYWFANADAFRVETVGGQVRVEVESDNYGLNDNLKACEALSEWLFTGGQNADGTVSVLYPFEGSTKLAAFRNGQAGTCENA